MATYTFDAKVAYAPNTQTFVPGLLGAIYLDTDTGFTTPMTVTPLGGSPAATLTSGTAGLIPDFTLNQASQSPVLTGTQGARVVWKSGSHQITLTSEKFLIDEVTGRLSTSSLDASYLAANSQQASADGREHLFWVAGAWKIRLPGGYATPGARPAWAFLGRHFQGDTLDGASMVWPTSLQVDGDRITIHSESPLGGV